MLSIIVPAYNCKAAIPDFLARWTKELGTRIDVEVIVADNASTDGTASEIERLCKAAGERRISVYSVPQELPAGSLLQAGLKKSIGSVMAWTDALPDALPVPVLMGFETYRINTDREVFIKGSNSLSFRRVIEERYLTMLGQKILKAKVSEAYCCPKLFSRAFYNKYLRTGAPPDETFELYAVYCAVKNAHVLSVDIPARKAGSPEPPLPPHRAVMAQSKAFSELAKMLQAENRGLL